MSAREQLTPETNPGPSDHESYTLCMSPPSKDYWIVVLGGGGGGVFVSAVIHYVKYEKTYAYMEKNQPDHMISTLGNHNVFDEFLGISPIWWQRYN